MNALSIRSVFKVITGPLSCGHIKQWLCVESITQRQVWHTCGHKHKQREERTTIPVKLIAGRRCVFHQKLRNVLNSAPRREVQKKKANCFGVDSSPGPPERCWEYRSEDTALAAILLRKKGGKATWCAGWSASCEQRVRRAEAGEWSSGMREEEEGFLERRLAGKRTAPPRF